MAVNPIIGALICSFLKDQNIDDSSSDDLHLVQEADDDMILSYSQNDSKIEALAQRDLPKSGTKQKKGGKSSLFL